MSIFVLTLRSIEEGNESDFYFSDLERASNFIKENFSWDNVRKIDNELYEGKNNQYIIEEKNS